jgi:hypothetical protein
MAISRAKKAREAEKRKRERQLARQAVRERLAREKVERQAVREAKRAEKVAEVIKRRQEVEERRAQRMRVKEAKEAAVQPKKRSPEEDEVGQPQKRVRANASRTRNMANPHILSSRPDCTMAQHSASTISEEGEASNAVHTVGKQEVPISHSRRSGRVIRLPRRFR